MVHHQQPQINSHFKEEWKKFKRAFFKSKDDFNPFVWILRLVNALGYDIRDRTGIRWRPIIPIFAVLLILLIVTSYFWKLRNDLVQVRWCNTTTSNKSSCSWLHVHDFLVIYFTIMILFHFLQTSFSKEKRMQSKSTFDIETKLLLLYGEILQRNDNNSNNQYHPSPYGSVCTKCNSTSIDTNTNTIIRQRPPRCHHCRICNACVLQYDHHCLWMNNCIGYNNVRSFVLTVFYITIGCWYGILLLYQPFYIPLQNILRQHGGFIPYIQKYMSGDMNDEKTLFDFPTMDELKVILFSNDHDTRVLPVQFIIDIVFPFLFAVGGIIAIFLGTHIKLVVTARTTLEHRIYLNHQYDLLTKKLKREKDSDIVESSWINPYDQGSYYKNWVQIMGDNWFYLFLPIHIDPPPPYIPKISKKE
jgi:hypothetical protein